MKLLRGHVRDNRNSAAGCPNIPPSFREDRMKTKEEQIAHLQRYVSCEPNSGCWIWIGRTDRDGYGKTRLKASGDEHWKRNKPKNRLVHRVMYELLRGPIPLGLHIDHLCRVRSCCNPYHLEPVTCKINIQRGISYLRGITHCPHGHEYTEANTRRKMKKGYMSRDCKTCDHRRQVEKRIRQGKGYEIATLIRLGIPIPS